MESATKQAALDLASKLGWSVFPCRFKSKIPATSDGFKSATKDASKIEKLFSSRPDLNLAMATGEPSGVWVLDLDGKKGIEAFALLEEENGTLPTTVSSKTGGGGRHLFFRLNGDVVRNRAKINGEAIDVRGTGGYVVLPPSEHSSGNSYAWENDPETPIAEAPRWLVDLVLDSKATVPSGSSGLSFVVGGGLDLATDSGASKGCRHDQALRLIGSAFGRGLDLASVAQQAVKWARKCDPAMDESEILRLVGDLGRKHGGKAKATPSKPLVPPTPWQPFPVSCLPEPVQTLVCRASEAIKCDPAYVATAMLPALAGAIGTSRQIQLKRGWIEPSVLWGVVCGDSGSMKSPAVDIATNHIRDRQAKSVEVHRQLIESYEKDLAEYKLLYDDWKRSGRKKGEPAPGEPEQPICERICCSDVTVEGLAVLLADAPRGLLLIRDEIAGWLASHDQYKSGRGADTAHWLTIHGARDLVVDRKTGDRKTLFVRRASVSIVGGIQPRTLARSLGQEHFENGLAARLLLAMPPRRPKVWSEAEIDESLDQSVAQMFDRLLELQHTIDGDPITLGLSSGGKQAWVKFYDEHADRMLDASGSHAAVLSKLEGGAARIALILHIVRQVTGDRTATEAVDEHSISSGVAIARWYAREAERIYAVLSETDEQREARQAVDLIRRRGGKITANDLRRRSRHLATSEDADRLLRLLVDAGLGSWEDQAPGTAGGRPTRIFSLSESPTVYPYPKPPPGQVKKEVSDTDTGIQGGMEEVTI